jgi:hypothetical protein
MPAIGCAGVSHLPKHKSKPPIQAMYCTRLMCQRNHQTLMAAYLIHDNYFLVMGPEFRRINGTNMVGVALWVIRASFQVGFSAAGLTITAMLGCISCK